MTLKKSDFLLQRWRTAEGCVAPLFFLLAVILILNASLTRTPPILGDGMEYFLMSQALLTRGEPSLQRSDMLALDRALQRTGPGKRMPFLDASLRSIETDNEWNTCYYRAKNGKMYSFHYWMYSLSNVPALAASRILGFAPTRSFPITNSLLILLAAFVVLFKARLPAWARIAALLMFLLSGTTFYLDWSGPEVFTACFVLIGCVFLLSEKQLFAALAFAAAAQQNPPVGVLAATALAFWMWHCIAALRNGDTSLRKLAPEFLGAAAVVAFVLQSPLFYWTHFGVTNLIVAKGVSSPEYVSFPRLLSYYFDFDQGVVRGAPILLCGLFAAFLIALSRLKLAGGKRSLLLGLAFVAASIAIATPAMSTPVWVSSSRVILRYALWGSVPLWIAAVYFLENLTPRRRNLMLAFVLCGQAAWIVGVYRLDGSDVNPFEHSWLSKYFIEHYPDHYNPDPNVFNVRTSGSRSLLFPPYPGNVYYLEHPGRISKLLYHKQSRTNWIPECAATPADLEKAPGVERINAGANWAYLNLGKACPVPNNGGLPTFWVVYEDRYQPLPPEGASFKSGGNWDQFTWAHKTGWSDSADWGTWIDGDTASVSLLLDSPPHGALTLTLVGIGAAPPGQSPPATIVYVNGVKVGTVQFAATATSAVLAIAPSLVARSNGIFHVRLYVDNAVSEKAIGQEADKRKPRIGIISMNLRTP
jgi:hypothetical protein